MQHKACGLLAEVGYSLDHQPRADIPTLATNGRQLFYNPEYTAPLSDAELETSLLHEYAHVALLHPVRFNPKTQEQKQANVAMDHAANLWVKACGRTIPESWYLDVKYDGMAWEAIYALLQNQEPNDPPPPPPDDDQPQPDQDEQQPEPDADQGADEPDQEPAQDDESADSSSAGEQDEETPAEEPGNAAADAGEGDSPTEADGEGEVEPTPGPGKPGQPQGDVQPLAGKDGHPADDAERSAAAAELTDRIARIAQAQVMAGQGSEGAQRYLEKMNTARDPDLYEALAALLERSANDHTYRRLNRRLLNVGIFPGIDGEECPPLVIAIDTSGSINDRILAAFDAKLQQAIADFRPRAITVIYCDDRINGTPETYTADDTPTLTPYGGGGTDFRPPFEWVDANMTEPPAALVYLTDLEGSAPKDAPAYPVIWAAIPSTWPTIPAFGQIVPLTL